MHRHLPLLAILGLPLLTGAQCRQIAEDLPILDKAALEVFLLHTPDVAAEYGIESDVGSVTLLDVYLYKPLDTGGNTQVSGAAVRALMPNGNQVGLDEIEPGHYQVSSIDKPGLYFEERGSYEVIASLDDQTWSGSALAFVATEITAPEDGSEIEAGAPLTVTMASPAEAMVAVVVDDEGNQVYDTLPSSAEDLLELVDGEGVRAVEIDGQALAGEGVFLVGAAGIERAEWQDHSDNLAESLSVFASGSLDAVAVSTMPLEGMAGIVMAIQGDDLEPYGIEIPDQVQAMLYGIQVDLTAGLEEQPITGGDAALSWGAGEVDLTESADTDGLYEATTDTHPGLAYHAGLDYAFALTDGDEVYRLTMTAPEAPTLNSPEPMSYHAPGTTLELNCPGGKDLCFVAVLDGDGAIVWDDLPTAETAADVFTGDEGTAGGETLIVPGSVFTAAGGLYAIGLIGLDQLGDSGWSDTLNAEAVDMYIGTSAFTAVTTVQTP